MTTTATPNQQFQGFLNNLQTTLNNILPASAPIFGEPTKRRRLVLGRLIGSANVGATC
jgi:hypothetical protein